MPLPFILGAAAIVAAGFGVKKGLDGKSDLDDAKYYQENADNEKELILKKLENQKEKTNKALISLGKRKKESSEIIEIFNKIICYKDEYIENSILLPMASNNEKMPKIIITRDEEKEILIELGIINKNLSTVQIEEM